MLRWPWDKPRTEPARSWWAIEDFPVRQGNGVTPLVDGHTAMLAMCRAFLSARRSILVAGWDIRADLPMVRGEDVHVGAAGSAEQRALLDELRAGGLDDAALAFWDAGNLRVMDVLGFAASRGVRVGVLLWDAFHLGSHLTNDPEKERSQLESAGVQVLLDDSSRKVKHITQALHQKCAVVDGRVAFLGGLDLTRAEEGDYDRWDTHGHLCDSPERSATRSAASHPWHDVHAQLEGPIVGDVHQNIVQRWDEVAQRHAGAMWPASLQTQPPQPISRGVLAQIARTIPPDTYEFAPKGIQTILQVYRNAISRAQTYIYLESQYFWQHVFIGLDEKRWGGHSEQMTQLLEALAAALGRGVEVALVVPDHPNAGRRFTDDGIADVRALARDAASRLRVYTLGNSDEEPNAPGGILYRPVYVHAKVAVVDDAWWTLGSANLNSRGMFSDAELNVAVLDGDGARALRTQLWTEHLHPSDQERHDLADPLAGLALLKARAAANAGRVRDRERLIGHILPYVTAHEARALRLPVHPEHGWLDNIDGGAGALPEKYAHRYL
jgi:phosphatidylserine/phosphatidylglycerophosphate/cardiolipin synthase-like enzyme